MSVLPTMWGEKIVARLLDKSNLQLDMTRLGFEEKVLEDFKAALHKPYGMILITGPTGREPYALLGALGVEQVDDQYFHAEDPVEYNLFGINQVQMHDDIGLNFASRSAVPAPGS